MSASVVPPIRRCSSSDSAEDSKPIWTPDGKIIFNSSRDGDFEIYIMNANSSSVSQITNNSYKDYDPALSPDGEKIIFVSERDGNPEIYSMSLDGSSQTNLTNNSGKDYGPDWSPDGIHQPTPCLDDWTIPSTRR